LKASGSLAEQIDTELAQVFPHIEILAFHLTVSYFTIFDISHCLFLSTLRVRNCLGSWLRSH